MVRHVSWRGAPRSTIARPRQAPEHLVWLGRLGLGGITRREAGVSHRRDGHPPGDPGVRDRPSGHPSGRLEPRESEHPQRRHDRRSPRRLPVVRRPDSGAAGARRAAPRGHRLRGARARPRGLGPGRARRHRALGRGARPAGRPARRPRAPQPHGQRPVPGRSRRVTAQRGGSRARRDRGGRRRGSIGGPAAARWRRRSRAGRSLRATRSRRWSRPTSTRSPTFGARPPSRGSSPPRWSRGPCGVPGTKRSADRCGSPSP